MSTAHDKLAMGRLKARNRAPYFSELLLSFVPREWTAMKTVAVTKNLIFLWHPDAIAEWSHDTIEFAFLHEAMHVALRHHDRGVGRDQALYNIAGDIFINDQLREMRLNIPKEIQPVFPETFGFPKNLTTDEYYDLLWKEAQKNDAGGKGQEGKGLGSGKCGGCAGNPQEGEGDGSGNGKSDSQDGEGQGSGGRSEAEVASIVRRTADAVAQAAEKSRGSVPAGLARWAEVALGPAKIPWQTKLAKVARAAIAYRPGAVDYRWSKPSRRQAALGWGPGRPVIPGFISPVPNVMVALDTSGSMGEDDVRIALEETKGILAAVGSDVAWVACDAAVHVNQRVRSVQDAVKLVKGGGGTDFHPIFEAASKAAPRPELLVICTDGCGPAPAVPPAGIKVIWLLVGSYRQTPYTSAGPVTYGEVIEAE